MSVVLVIVGILSAMIFPALTAVRQSLAQSVTAANLQTLMRTTAAYAQTRGCLPCPTPATTSGPGFGIVRGDASPLPAACGACSPSEGLVPYASMGLPPSLAKDGWGRWITMRIDSSLATPTVVPPTTPCTAADVAGGLCALQGAAQKGLCSTNFPPGDRLNVTTRGGGTAIAAVIFVSHGANGFGAFVANARYASGGMIHRLGVPDKTTPLCSAGPEACNASYSTSFADADQGADFDDQLSYLGRDALVAFLGQGSCQ